MDISAPFASSCEADDKNLLIERVGDDYYRELVCESAIDPQVAVERGYYSVKYDWYHLHDELGFPKRYFGSYYVEPMGCGCFGDPIMYPDWMYHNQIYLPVLVVPRRSPDGETFTYEIKPQNHSFRDNRKYINPPNQELVLDVHPQGFQHLKNPEVPVWITEGAKKLTV